MSETIARKPEFGDMVRAEVRRVLADPLFVKAPVQSRLLHFLASRTVGGGQAPNQFTVAVDGLGKSESYDLSSDSYPRVQISRLRKNLASYYARQQGGDGLCLFLRRGDYQLRLAPIEKAYPELIESKAWPGMPHPSSDPAPEEAGTGGPPPSATPPAQSVHPAPTRRRMAFVAGTLAALALAAALLWAFTAQRRPHSEPTVAVKVEASDAAGRAMAANIARAAGRELANSFVSDFTADTAGSSNYLVEVSLGTQARSATVTLYDRAFHSLYVESFDGVTGQDDLIRHIGSEIIYLTSRDGPIARTERQMIGNTPASAYECYLRTVDPNYEAQVLDQSGQCLARFPDSLYRARWLGLQAYQLYQADIAAGRPVLKSGPGWTALQSALEADPREPFANFVAAKVELAGENCTLAERFVQRALEPAASYPALLVAATANASGCAPSGEFRPRAAYLRGLIQRTPTIDPFFQVNLMLSSIAIGQPDDARTVAQAIVVGKSSPATRRAADLIGSALLERGFFAAHRAEIVRAVALFVWSPRGRDVIVQKLGEAAPR